MSKAMSVSPACYSSSDLAYARYNEEVSRNINNAANQVGDGKHIGVTHINKNSNPAHHFLKRERFDIAVNDACTCMCWFVLMTIHLPRSFYHLTPLWMVVHLHIKGGVPAKQKKERKGCVQVYLCVRVMIDRGEKRREKVNEQDKGHCRSYCCSAWKSATQITACYWMKAQVCNEKCSYMWVTRQTHAFIKQVAQSHKEKRKWSWSTSTPCRCWSATQWTKWIDEKITSSFKL